MIKKPSSDEKFSIQFGSDSELVSEKKVLSFCLDQKMDESGSFDVVIGVLSRDVLKVATNSIIPERVRLSWGGEVQFIGDFLDSRWKGRSQLMIRYIDPLFRLKKCQFQSWTKQKTLQRVLGDACAELDIETDFLGSFDEELSGFSFSGRTCFSAVEALSRSYGFHFYYDASLGKLVFQRVGQSRKDISLTFGENIADTSWNQTLTHSVDEVNTSYFGASQLDSSEKRFGSKKMLEPVKKWSSEQRTSRNRRSSAFKGRRDVLFHDQVGFDQSKDLVPLQYSKEMLGIESTYFRSFSPVCTLGDSVELSSKGTGQFESGDYLVGSVRVESSSINPIFIFSGVRV